jgi:pyridoxine/pyridoxamine 5'-phosphate oxidase
LDPVGDAVAFPKSIEFWKDRRIRLKRTIGVSR